MFSGLNMEKSSISTVFLCNTYRNHVRRVPDLLPRVANLKISYSTSPSHLNEKLGMGFFSALKCHDNRCCASDSTRGDYEILPKKLKHTQVQPILVGNLL